jgi:hypothetical protein
MPNPAPARYRNAHGVWHDVRVHRAGEARWEVLDVAGDDRRVVEVLLGDEQTRCEAEALARDYAAQHHHHAPVPGLRPPDSYGFAA